MASGVGGLSADRPPCARPSGLRLPRGLWESGLILRSFMACKGDGDLVGGLVLAQAPEGGVAQHAIARPAAEFDFGDQIWPLKSRVTGSWITRRIYKGIRSRSNPLDLTRTLTRDMWGRASFPDKKISQYPPVFLSG